MIAIDSQSQTTTRRRFIAIAAAVGGLGLISGVSRAETPQTFTWRGIALGANASLTLQHPNHEQAALVIQECLCELARLEAIFSLYRADSAIVRLNATGHLEDAPSDLRVLLAEALMLAERSKGAFDPSIQPLWALYASHFSLPGADPSGPNQRAIAAARALVDWRKIDLQADYIRLGLPGMALSLNGIAQGYITDKIGELLKGRGFTHVLVNMGEQLALGRKWDGETWSVGVANPQAPDTSIERISISSGAVATSGGYGFRFDAGGRFTHILDPATGAPARRFASVTVVSDRATLADGLSTALSIAEVSHSAIDRSTRVFVVPEGSDAGHWLELT